MEIDCRVDLTSTGISTAGPPQQLLKLQPPAFNSDDQVTATTAMAKTGDVMRHDMGLGLPFRGATFDGCISVSALQWLCYANLKEHSAKKRLMRFFSSLYSCLKRTGKAALQFYPENPEQAVLIASCASNVGFTGGLVVDFPNSSKAKKYYLCLGFEHTAAPRALGTGQGAAEDTVRTAGRDQQRKPKRGKSGKRKTAKDRTWILEKKERLRQKIGEERKVRRDTKYTGRKRKDRM